jgi:hypothetical protein
VALGEHDSGVERVSMAHQSDYGKGSELVPAGLRCYRHYKLNGHTLTAAVTVSDPVLPGVNYARCVAAEHTRAKNGCPQCYGRGHIVTRTAPSPRVFDFYAQQNLDPQAIFPEVFERRVDCECLIQCNVPRLECTCGFYASYDPQTNFFEEYAMQAGMGGLTVDLPPIFAVVEATGRVLMGTKGVRAEKMEVKAICVDLLHVRRPDRERRYVDVTSFSDFRTRWIEYDPYREDESRERLERACDEIGTNYGIPSYGCNMNRMVADFPAADLSNILNSQEQYDG